jgi:hypothetical protein
MALIKSIELDNGIVLPSAFIKICRIRHDIVNSNVNIEVSLFKDQDAFINDKPEVGTFSYDATFSLYDTFFNEPLLKSENVTLFTQAELYLLSLPYFSGATQV